jgi:hypothetical protein
MVQFSNLLHYHPNRAKKIFIFIRKRNEVYLLEELNKVSSDNMHAQDFDFQIKTLE